MLGFLNRPHRPKSAQIGPHFPIDLNLSQRDPRLVEMPKGSPRPEAPCDTSLHWGGPERGRGESLKSVLPWAQPAGALSCRPPVTWDSPYKPDEK